MMTKEKTVDFLKSAQEEAALRTDTFVAIIDEAIKNANSSKKKNKDDLSLMFVNIAYNVYLIGYSDGANAFFVR